MLKTKHKNLLPAPTPPPPQHYPKRKPTKTNNKNSNQTNCFFSSFGQLLAASLDRARKESKWDRELSLNDQIRTGTITQTFHYFDQLSLPDHPCASPFLFVLFLSLLIYDVMPFRFARHLKCR